MTAAPQPGADARRAAACAMMRQEQNGYANLVLAKELDRFCGAAKDRALAAAIFYGTVERMATIDWILGRFLARPLRAADAGVRAILRTGLYQARWMDGVPVHAAVDESVSLCRRMGRGKYAGLVNAVLRRAASFDLAAVRFSGEEERLCVLYSVSPQVARLLQSAFPGRCEEILAASFAPPAFSVRANLLRTTPQALCERFAREGVEAREGDVPGSVVANWRGKLTSFAPFREGLFHVQGQTSQLACRLLDARPGQKVVDLCAAPGGKSATLAQDMENRGRLVCRDAAQNRVPLIDAALRRLGVTCAETGAADAAEFDGALCGAQRVLCDVPCSGLGTMAKKPDVRYKTLEGIDRLVETQRAILETGARYLETGGRLVYSTCTLNPAENEDVVREFLRRHPEFAAVPCEGLPTWAQQGPCGVTVLPLLPQCDGFFIAPMQKMR